MPTKYDRRLKPTGNEELMNAIRASMYDDYKQRVPAATKANIQETIDSLMSHKQHRNDFVDALVNKIGLTEFTSKTWSNPLAEFKRGLLSFGESVEQVQAGLIEARTYDPNRDKMERDIFGTSLPEVQSQFHTRNRQEFYKITVSEMQLRTAFTEPGGLSNLVSGLMSIPETSNNWDEFLLMTSMIPEMQRAGGFFHVNVPNLSEPSASADENEASAKSVLKQIRAYSENLKFLSTRYNAARMPVFAQPDELVLLTTPEAKAAFDVDALAAAFNVDRAEAQSRIVTIPAERFGVDGVQAVLTTRDFFNIWDTFIDTREADNPVNVSRNYFLHVHQIISASRFAPAIMFWTGADDSFIELTSAPVSVDSITVTDRERDTVATALTRGTAYNLEATVTTDPDGTHADSVKWSIGSHTSDYTRVTNDGVLFVGGDERVDSLDITATTTYVDPDDPSAAPLTGSETRTVEGDIYPVWPDVDEPADDGGTGGE